MEVVDSFSSRPYRGVTCPYLCVSCPVSITPHSPDGRGRSQQARGGAAAGGCRRGAAESQRRARTGVGSGSEASGGARGGVREGRGGGRIDATAAKKCGERPYNPGQIIIAVRTDVLYRIPGISVS